MTLAQANSVQPYFTHFFRRCGILPLYGLLCIVLFTCTLTAEAQNLVPNPGFEEYTRCPNGISEIAFSPGYDSFPTVKAWINPLYETTPDYFNECAPEGSHVRLPNTLIGYQYARTGKGCAGIVFDVTGEKHGDYMVHTDTGMKYKELIECRLLQPLKAGKEYKVTFYVSFTFNSGTAKEPSPFHAASTDELGACFSESIITDPDSYSLSLPYHIKTTKGTFLNNTTEWMKISGTYMATGNEQYMLIGKFKKNAPDTLHIEYYSPSDPIPPIYSTYYFIDDVSVEEIRCDTLHRKYDTVICNQSIKLTSSMPGADYQWSNGTRQPNLEVTEPGIYWCKAINECSLITDTFYITKSAMPSCNECLYYVPTAFSPDKNRLNDDFGLIASCPVNNYTMKIFNRWGNLVFESSHYLNRWNGRYNNIQSPTGVYFYYISFVTGNNNTKKMFKGDITLLR